MIGRLLLAAVAAVPMLLAGTAVASAQNSQEVDAGGGRHVVGVVTGEHGQVLEVRTRRGQVDVHWDDATECAVNGEPARCADIAAGMGIAATGSYAGDSNQFHADSIRARARIGDHARVAGSIISERGQTLVVETREGRVIDVSWGDDTTCRTRTERFECERLEVGQHILAVGKFDDAGTLHARLIGLALDDHADVARVRGIVAENSGRTLVVETRDGRVVVHYDADTSCLTRDGRIECASIGEGAGVLAAGERLDDGSIDARRIIAFRVHDRPTDRPTTDLRPSDRLRAAQSDAAGLAVTD